MDLRKVTQLGYATCAQIPHKENLGFKIFEVAGIFQELSKSSLETILQLPRGLEIKPNGSILSVERLYTNSGHYLIFFVEYGFADFEQTTGGRPCFYAGAVGYVFEGRNPNTKELLDFLYLVTKNAKQKTIYLDKEPIKITLPKFFSTQTQTYKYAPSDAKMRGYFYLPNVEEQKFGFVELAYSKNFETYQRIFGISSQEIINDIKDKSIVDLRLALPQANEIKTEIKQEQDFVETESAPQTDTTETVNDNQKDLQKENIVLRRENESLRQEVKRLSDLNNEQNEIILQIRKEQSEKTETGKNIVDLRLIVAIIVAAIIFLFVVYKLTEPQTTKLETQPNQEQLLDSINVLNRTISSQLRDKNRAVLELEKKINAQNAEITDLKKELEVKRAVPISQPIYHVVKSGENLALISKKYNVSIKELMQRNPSDIKADSSVKDGVKLFIKKE